MINKLLVIFLLLFAQASYSQSKACIANTKKAKKLAEQCKAMAKGSTERKRCVQQYRVLKNKVQTGCADQSISDEAINKWKAIVKKCGSQKTKRCANALKTLASFTYKKEQASHLEASAKYDKAYTRWIDNDQRGTQPREPKADHRRSLAYMERFIKEFPKHSSMPNILLQASHIYEGKLEDKKAYDLRMRLVTEFPNTPYVAQTWLRIGEYYYDYKKHRKAIESYQKVRTYSSLSSKETAMAIYHQAESYINIGEYYKAAQTFYDYVEGADKGVYPNDFRAEAMIFMAGAFADMDNGIDVAEKFMSGKQKTFADTLYYEIGMKNKMRDRLDEARYSFKRLLEISPNFVNAPMAELQLIGILVEKKEHKEAQEARMRVIQNYDENSDWYLRNRNNKEAVQTAQRAIRLAYFEIPKHYHSLASQYAKQDQPEDADESYRLAEQYYLKFMEQYPKESWDHYLVHMYLAGVYDYFKKLEELANVYNWIDDVDESKLGRKPKGFPAVLSKRDAGYNAVVALDNNRIIAAKSKAGGNLKKAYNLPETKMYLEQVDKYMVKYGKEKEAPDIAYNAALVHYEADQFETAVVVLQKLKKDFPNHQRAKKISAELARSLTQAGQFKLALTEYKSLLNKYQTKDPEYEKIKQSIAAVMFQIGEKHYNEGKYLLAAKQYVELQQKYPKFEYSDKALFEAGNSYEKANNLPKAAKYFLDVHKIYAKSDLAVKGILRAANAMKKGKQHTKAATTFLLVTEKYPKDSMAFASIGYAATVYEESNNKRKAAETYLKAQTLYPQNEKTPSFVFNACLTYEEIKLTQKAIECNKNLVKNYPNSSYSLDAAYSIPLAYEKAKDWKNAADAYVAFASSYDQDKGKHLAAYIGAARAYSKVNDAKNANVNYQKVIEVYEKFGLKMGADPVIAAEAAFMLGEFEKSKMTPVVIKGKEKQKKKIIDQLTKDLQEAVKHYSKSVSYNSEKWTFKATNEMGNLFVILSDKIKNQDLTGLNKEEKFGKKIEIVQSLPSFYESARSLFEKNIQIAREQGFYNKEVINAEEGYIEMWYKDAGTYLFVAEALRASEVPNIRSGANQIPKDALIDELVNNMGYTKKEVSKDPYKVWEDQYRAQVEEKAQGFEDLALPVFASGIEASAHYKVDNKWTAKIHEDLIKINPDHEALAIKIEKFDPTSLFKDVAYFKQKARIEQIFATSDEVMSQSDKRQVLNEIIQNAEKVREGLVAKVAELEAKLAPKTPAGGTAAPAK